jgi:hypothetical protein
MLEKICTWQIHSMMSMYQKFLVSHSAFFAHTYIYPEAKVFGHSMEERRYLLF